MNHISSSKVFVWLASLFTSLLLAAPALAAEIWIPTASMNNVRVEHPAVLLADGKVLVAGGYPGGSTVLAATEIFDPSTGTWTSVSPMTRARFHHTLTVLQDGKILAVGGSNPNDSTVGNTAELYDPVIGSWVPTGAMIAPRNEHTATLLPDGKVLVAGGVNNINLQSAELFDPVTGTWSAVSPMIATRRQHSATLLPSGKVLVAGGGGFGSGIGSLSSAELYDPVTGLWTVTGSMANPRNVHVASLLNDGKVLVSGGRIIGTTPTATAEIYNPLAGTWSVTAPMDKARAYHTASLMQDGKVLIAGGYSDVLVSGSTILALAEFYDPATNTWTFAPPMTARRNGHTSSLLNDGRILVTGGSGSGRLASAELFGVVNDTSAPTASPTQLPQANSAGWNNSDVTISWNWSDLGGSSINPASCVMNSVSSSEGNALQFSATCSDYAGNIGSAGYSINVDKTTPILSGSIITVPNSNNWYNGDVVISWICSDALSGVFEDCPFESIVTDEGANLSASTSVTDMAGNNKNTTVGNIHIDRTAPDITGSATNADGSPYIPGTETNQAVTVHFTCSDSLSAIDSCTSDQIVNTGGITGSVNGTAVDKAGNSSVTSFGPIHIVNRAPILANIGNRTVDENATLQFIVTATDPDDNNVVYSATNLPVGATFDAQTGIFSWIPTFSQAGTYPSIEFVVTDDGIPVDSDSEVITISVVDVNRPPSLTTIGNRIVDEGDQLQFVVTANDPDEDNLLFVVSNLPVGATFDSGTGVFSWTPTFTQSGTYPNIEFTVTDDGVPVMSDSEIITITVNDVAPLALTAQADSFVKQGQENRNEGANPHLFIQSSGHNRTLVGFDSVAVSAYVAEHGISSATLVLTIAENGNNWGTTGRTVDAHPLLSIYAEGNGKDAGVPGAESTRGTGSGTTWNCATDSAIENSSPDCGSQWNGGSYSSATAAPVTHVNGQTGSVSWDVTSDVLNGSFGWLIKKTIEGQNGKMEYYSKEGAVSAGNILFAPRLILTP